MKATRRDFAKTLGVALCGGQAILPDQDRRDRLSSTLGHAMTEVVRSTYGQHLTSEELESIGKVLDEYGPYIEELRKFPLKNSDEPDFIFRA